MLNLSDETNAEVLLDQHLADVERGAARPDDWASRSLYVGEAGARNWLSVVHEPGYPLRDPDALGLRSNRLAAIATVPFRTLVSLGPGDGTADVDLMASRAERPAFIAVDISRPLLEAAIERLRPLAETVSGVLCDFENDGGLLGESLARRAVPPILFAMLGGTLGNVDRGEGRFLERLRGLMRPGDSLLLDVPLAGPAWSAAVEPRMWVQAYSPAFRVFLLGASAGEIPFEDRVGLASRRDEETGAEVVEVSDRLTGHRILTFRRYRWDTILDWLTGRGFEVAFARSNFAPPGDVFGMGVALLTRS